MASHLVKLAVGGLLLGCTGCVVAPGAYPGAYQQTSQTTCRQVVQPMTVNGASVPGYGVQCQNPDGTWEMAVPLSPAPPGQPVAGAAPPPSYVPGYAYPGPYYGYPGYYGPLIGFDFGGGGWGGGWGGGRGGGGFYGGGHGEGGEHGGGFGGGRGGR